MNDGLLKKQTNINQNQTTKTVKIGKSEYTVISVFNGTRTASSILYDAAVQRIIADQLNF